VTEALALVGTFAFCVLSGLVPFVNAEAYLLAAAAVAPASFVLPIVIAGTLGQMVAKVGMYGAGRGVLMLPGTRIQRWVDLAKSRYGSYQRIGGGLIFLSASSGFPPFYVVSIACGMLRTPLPAFIVLGTIGRFIRFGIVVLVPYLLKN
jgi:membrane protein YqaA with SNARE-associated domain